MPAGRANPNPNPNPNPIPNPNPNPNQVARCDVPLRELLQPKQGKLLKYAQLFATADADASPAQAAPRVVGSVVYEMRMRRRIDVPNPNPTPNPNPNLNPKASPPPASPSSKPKMRMRRRIDVPVHSFMQRFPDVASLALAPARPGCAPMSEL